MPWEFDLLYALQEIHSPVLDKLMVFFSVLGDSGIMWIALAVILLCWKNTRKCGMQMGAAMLITFIIGNLILKNLVARDRPCWIDESVQLLLANPWDYSFPSGHSMNGFTAAVTICFYHKKWGAAAVVIAGIIAFSRLYNFVHFPTDVFAGIAIGICSAVFTNWLFRKISKKHKDTNLR